MFVLHDYFRNPGHSVLRTVRLISMIAFGIFVIVSLGIASRNGFEALNCPAKCVLLSNPPVGFNFRLATGASSDYSPSTANNISLLFASLLVLIMSYLLAIIPMFMSVSSENEEIYSWSVASVVVVCLSTVNFGLGIDRLFWLRDIAQDLAHNREENVWGFGQILPLLLLLIPVLQGLEILYGSHRKSLWGWTLSEQKNVRMRKKQIMRYRYGHGLSKTLKPSCRWPLKVWRNRMQELSETPRDLLLTREI